MIKTIQHQDYGVEVVVAKLLTGYLRVSGKISDTDSYIKANGTFDAGYVSYVLAWLSNHALTSDGVIGPATWTAIASSAPTCSTSKNRTSAPTLALQLLLDTNITCDGIFGAKTKAAVVAFQDANGLYVDGIFGAKTWAALIVGAEAKPAPVPSGSRQPVDYKQGDSRWGKKMYSNHGDKGQTMSNSGCGPTSMADVVATLKDPSVTPWDLAQKSMAWGDRTRNSGTAWTFFGHIAEEYGFVKMVQSKNWSALTACLDAGGYVVCSMGPGYWTKGGHFICAWKYDDTYVYCNDPASSTRKKQRISEFKAQRKQFFCFYPDPADEPVKEPAEDACGDCMIRGEKIVDISKWQPIVDYDALISDTALIILRAGLRGTGGSVRMDECFEKHAAALKKRGIRFGVYFYSIASTAAKAREEAQAFFKYARDYDPLFWAIDVELEEISQDAIRAFVHELRVLGAGKVGCYVANHLYKTYGYGEIRSLFDFTWIPRYGATKPAYACDLWQHTSTGRVAGIDGNVDLNTITGQGRPLDWFAGGDAE